MLLVDMFRTPSTVLPACCGESAYVSWPRGGNFIVSVYPFRWDILCEMLVLIFSRRDLWPGFGLIVLTAYGSLCAPCPSLS